MMSIAYLQRHAGNSLGMGRHLQNRSKQCSWIVVEKHAQKNADGKENKHLGPSATTEQLLTLGKFTTTTL